MTGRKSTYPCSNGKKYKNSCLRKNEPAKGVPGGFSKVDEVDELMVSWMLDVAAQRFGDAWLRATEGFENHEARPPKSLHVDFMSLRKALGL